jgi:hypothetical protein
MKDQFKKILEHTTISKVIIAIGSISIVLVIFNAGIFVGYHKAQFSQARGEQYKRGYNDPKFFLAPFMQDKNNQNPNGTVGKILSISGNTALIELPNDTEQTIHIGSSTKIRYPADATSTRALESGLYIAVIGKPNTDGDIDASFIRVLPPPPADMSTSSRR